MGLTLTKRHGIPMCGVPHHSAEGYIGRLVKGGKRVAIAEQTTIPQPGKLVERELTRVISAGTLADMDCWIPPAIITLWRCTRTKSASAWHAWTIPRGNFPWPSSNTWICFWTSCPASIPPNSWSATSRRTASRNPPHALLRRIYFSAFHGHSQFAEPFPGAFPGRFRLRGDDRRPGGVRRGAPLSGLPAPPPHGPLAPHFRARHGERRAD